MKAYAIRHKITKRYMPMLMSKTGARGWSNWDPYAMPGQDCGGLDDRPRIFFSRPGVDNALTQWLRGRHVRTLGHAPDGPDGPGEDYDEVHVEPVEGRHRAAMEVVELEIQGL